MSGTLRAWVVLASAVIMAGSASAQQPPPVRRDTLARRDSLQRGDTLRLDTLRRAARQDTLRRPPGDSAQRDPETIGRGALDSVAKKIDVEWATPDSVMNALLGRSGYSVTRYQGNRVRFEAVERTMYLVGKRAAVQRDSATLIGDTIQFNDSTNLVIARGDTLLLRDPSQGQDDILALGSIRYDVTNRRGVVRNVTTAVESGQRWIVHGDVAAFKGDTTGGGAPTFYARHGWLTSCEELEPHYHFAAREMKLVSKNVMVVRPAILYIADIPVMWLPFVFQDMRSGRRSGIIAPRIGFNQIFRQSPFLRRTIEDIGYYFALNDYTDAQVSMDWRSDARATDLDPGYLKFNGAVNYNWRDQFIRGQLGASYHYLRNGSTNTQYSLNHQQEFSQRTRLTASFNYVTNTTIQRNISFNPQQAMQTIRSSMNYSTGRGPFTLNLGGTQVQYPGREQLDRDFPSLSVTTKPISVGENFTWTPGLNISNGQSFNIDQVGDFAFRYHRDPVSGALDSIRVKRDTRRSSIAFETPLQIYGFNWRNSIRVTDALNDFPQRRIIFPDVNDTTVKQERVFTRDYSTGIDWDTGFNLPSFLQGSWNITPSVSFQKVDGRSPLIVRTERTGGKFVAQTMRPSYGLGVAPKLYGFFPGFGPVERIRHTIEPQVQFAYVPRGNVSNEFLAANGDVAQGYLGNNEQNTISFGFATNFEAKMRGAEDDTTTVQSGATDNSRKIKLLSLTFTTLSYDFVRARKSTGGTGLNNRTFDYTARSDLLPGFDIGVNYSLFLGDPMSDTAKFKPYREGIRGTLTLDQNSPLIRGAARLLGIRMLDEKQRAAQEGEREPGTPQSAAMRPPGGMVAGQPIMGSVNQAAMQIPSGQGWRMNLAYSSTRMRPPVGDNVQVLDPAIRCQQYIAFQLQYDACVRQQQAIGAVDNPYENTTRGGTFFLSPPQESIQGGTSFHVTNKWAAQWQTTYDVIRKEFATHVVSLQRELHDWDAIFSFSRSANGNSSFSFFIALRAQPEIKLDYDRPTFPRGYSGTRAQ